MIRRFGRPPLHCSLAYHDRSRVLGSGWGAGEEPILEMPGGPVHRFRLGNTFDKSNKRRCCRVVGAPCGQWRLYHVQQAACGYPFPNASSLSPLSCNHPLAETPFSAPARVRGKSQALNSACRVRFHGSATRPTPVSTTKSLQNQDSCSLELTANRPQATANPAIVRGL
jgi:hypothetical protein